MILRSFFCLLALSLTALGQGTTPTFQVKTVADLTNTAIPTINNRLSALVTGRTTENDGYGGLFFYQTNAVTTVDGGTIFKPATANGRWVRQYSGALEAGWFGAIGNGVADDTAALQLAIDAIMGSGTHSTLQLSDGIYKTTATLNIRATTNNTDTVQIVGLGNVGATSFSPMAWNGTMIRYSGVNATGPAIRAGNDTNFLFRVEIRNLRIGTSGQSPEPDGIVISHASEVFLDNVNTTSGFNAGIVMRGISNSRFERLKSEGNAIGVLVQNSPHTGEVLERCDFVALETFQNSVAGLKAEGTINNVHITDSWFEWNPAGILIAPVSGLQVMRNVAIDNTGFSVGNDTDYPNSRSIKMDAGVATGLYVQGFFVKNCYLYSENTDYNIELLFVSSANPGTLARGIHIDDVNAYGCQIAMIRNDWQNTELSYGGSITAVSNASGSGTVKPLFSGNSQTKRHPWLTDFYQINASDGLPIKLPTNNPPALEDGQFSFDPNRHRLQFVSGIVAGATNMIPPKYSQEQVVLKP